MTKSNKQNLFIESMPDLFIQYVLREISPDELVIFLMIANNKKVNEAIIRNMSKKASKSLNELIENWESKDKNKELAVYNKILGKFKNRNQYVSIVDSMGNKQVQLALREIEMEDLVIFLSLVKDEKTISKIHANMSKRASQQAKIAVSSMKSSDIEAEMQSFDRVLSILNAFSDKEFADDKIELSTFNSSNINDLLSLTNEIAEKAAKNGLISLTEDIRKIDNRLISEGLKAIININDPMLVEDYLEEMINRHLIEEKIRCKIIKESLLKIYNSEYNSNFVEYLEALVPFNNKPI